MYVVINVVVNLLFRFLIVVSANKKLSIRERVSTVLCRTKNVQNFKKEITYNLAIQEKSKKKIKHMYMVNISRRSGIPDINFMYWKAHIVKYQTNYRKNTPLISI